MITLILNETTFAQYKIGYFKVAYKLTFTNNGKVLLEDNCRVHSNFSSHTVPNCNLQLQSGESKEFVIYFTSEPIEFDTNETTVTGNEVRVNLSLNQLIKGVEIYEGLHLKATQIAYPVS